MALRAITVLKDVCAEMEELCPDAWIFNYTNPVNIVAEAITHNSPIKVVSLCEGPIYFRDTIAESARARPGAARRHDGRPQPRLLGRRAELRRAGPDAAARRGLGAAPATTRPSSRVHRRQLQLAVAMGAIPADYFQYYYFTDEVLAEYRAKPTTRAEDILGWSTDYWRHYEEQAQTRRPAARPRPLTGRHQRARARDRRDGRDLQRQGRGAPGQHAERGRRAARASPTISSSRCSAAATRAAST